MKDQERHKKFCGLTTTEETKDIQTENPSQSNKVDQLNTSSNLDMKKSDMAPNHQPLDDTLEKVVAPI